ncbi:MAG: hypothetical protein QXT38_04140 [Candidatus Aenigmatarchaeota archaeon]
MERLTSSLKVIKVSDFIKQFGVEKIEKSVIHGKINSPIDGLLGFPIWDNVVYQVKNTVMEKKIIELRDEIPDLVIWKIDGEYYFSFNIDKLYNILKERRII